MFLFGISVSDHALQAEAGDGQEPHCLQSPGPLPAVSDIPVHPCKLCSAGCSHLEEKQTLGQGSTRMCLVVKGLNKDRGRACRVTNCPPLAGIS